MPAARFVRPVFSEKEEKEACDRKMQKNTVIDYALWTMVKSCP